VLRGGWGVSFVHVNRIGSANLLIGEGARSSRSTSELWLARLRPIGGLDGMALVCTYVQRLPFRVSTVRCMPTPERTPPVWDDEDTFRQSAYRKTRIAELFRALDVMRPSRRHGDAIRLQQIEAELRLLLDAELRRLGRTGRAL
jgi:hypothetical protein